MRGRRIIDCSIILCAYLALSVVQTPSDVVFLSCTNRLTLPLFDDLGSTAGLSSAATRPPSGTRCAG
jgi:maleate cis-trans isomerase